MTTQYTPLPWEIHTGVFDGGGDDMTITTTNAARSICDIIGKMPVDEANAAFIVKACNHHADLVERLTELADLVENNLVTHECSDEAWKEELQKALAILAKVRQ